MKQNILSEMEDNAVVTMKWPQAHGQAEGSWMLMDEGPDEEVDPAIRGLIVYGTDGLLRTRSKGYVVEITLSQVMTAGAVV